VLFLHCGACSQATVLLTCILRDPVTGFSGQEGYPGRGREIKEAKSE